MRVRLLTRDLSSASVPRYSVALNAFLLALFSRVWRDSLALNPRGECRLSVVPRV